MVELRGELLENLKSRREAHVWHVEPESIVDPRRLAQYRSWLSTEEEARRRRFVFEKHRHTFLVSHALVRGVLSRYADVAPADWRFVAGDHGRPEIAADFLGGRLRFNLSHTQGMAVLAVVAEVDIGVDVEDADRRELSVDIAERYFAPQETADLFNLHERKRLSAFFDYWTLKESYIKARGMGLAIPLDRFAFRLSPDSPPTISFAAGFDDDPADWQFAQFRPSTRHRVAVAIRRGRQDDRPIVLRPILP